MSFPAEAFVKTGMRAFFKYPLWNPSAPSARDRLLGICARQNLGRRASVVGSKTSVVGFPEAFPLLLVLFAFSSLPDRRKADATEATRPDPWCQHTLTLPLPLSFPSPANTACLRASFLTQLATRARRSPSTLTAVTPTVTIGRKN